MTADLIDTGRRCLVCDEPIRRDPHKPGAPPRYCSRAHAEAARRSRQRIPARAALHAPRPCDGCGTSFAPRTRRQRFCSAECRYERQLTEARTDRQSRPRPARERGTRNEEARRRERDGTGHRSALRFELEGALRRIDARLYERNRVAAAG